jgi:dolichyl-phosphate-mannose-protein mannosyltransferase
MAPKAAASSRSGERPPPARNRKSAQGKPKDFTSHGIADHDIFMLPPSDLQLLGVLTVVAAIVRLFRIYQPSSVVFDEVQ